MGPELVDRMRNQAIKFGSEVLDENVVSVNGSYESGFTLKTDSGAEYAGKSIIIAVGSSPKKLGLPSEEKFSARGVSYCAVCDGAFFKNQKVIVVGGGDSAMEEANYLSKYASEVIVLVRGTRENMRASAIMVERAQKNPKVKFMFNSQVKEILGDLKVSSVIVTDSTTNSDTTIEASGVFVAIGWKPNTDFLGNFVEKDSLGYIKIYDHTKTSVNGVSVCGDSSDPRYRQAITASGTGAMAAIDVERFLSH
jgi:thioredoxin reductase (NADPH)